MKKLVLFAVAAALAMNVAQAADDEKKKAPRKGRVGGTQALLNHLDLNDDQKKKLAEFDKANRKKMAEIRKLKGDERKAKTKEANEARAAILKEVLTEKQQAKLKELKKARRSNNKGKKKKSEDK